MCQLLLSLGRSCCRCLGPTVLTDWLSDKDISGHGRRFFSKFSKAVGMVIMVTTRRMNGRCSKGWRRYRNYIFIVITMFLITMQVYLYTSTPPEVIERSRADDADAANGQVVSNVPVHANEDVPGRKLPVNAEEQPQTQSPRFVTRVKYRDRNPASTKPFSQQELLARDAQLLIPANGQVVSNAPANKDVPGRKLSAEEQPQRPRLVMSWKSVQRTKPVFPAEVLARDAQLPIPANGANNTWNGFPAQNGSIQMPLNCGSLERDVQSALERALSEQCKREIIEVACSYKRRELYPPKLPRFCPLAGTEYGHYVGCFRNEANDKTVADHVAASQDTNTPMACVNYCLRSGFEYAGVQAGFECRCGTAFPRNAIRLSEDRCNISCPGNKPEMYAYMCGSVDIANVYRTGFGDKASDTASFVDPMDPEIPNMTKVRIAFVLTVNGRSLRQVHRLFKALYRPHHYYYIHVDARHDYLHRELSKLAARLPNVQMAPVRFASIWGGASLLSMLLSCMKGLLAINDWHWDYFLNLSESDYPVKTVEELEAFLTKYSGKNFLKSHGKDTPRFIRKQGLNMLFYECDNHMWRLGTRDMQDGIRVDGGSDWICLHRDYVHYLIHSKDELVTGLKDFWKYSLLPGESFFHTVIQNSMYCTTIINNNLHLTNWHRKQGCKCQYKHIVDWCGCSPNDFLGEDLNKIQALAGKPVYFARKFEAIINQKIINDIDNLIGREYPLGTPSLDSFWLSEYHHLDSTAVDDVAYTFYLSFARLTLAKLQHGSTSCDFTLGRVLESTVYKYNDAIKGHIITFEIVSEQSNIVRTVEALLKPIEMSQSQSLTPPDSFTRLQSVKVGTNYDPKEEIFRNYGNMFGPQSDIVVELRWDPATSPGSVVTTVLIDPSGILACSFDKSFNPSTVVYTHHPEISRPLRPGMWTVKVLRHWRVVYELQFLVLPYSHLQNAPVDAISAQSLHSGPGGPYVKQSFDDLEKFLKLGNLDALKIQADENAKKHGPALLAWVDELVQQVWHVEDTCTVTEDALIFPSSTCLPVAVCKATAWSTKFPDPKSDLSDLNLKSGVLR